MTNEKEFILRQITTLSGVMDTFYKRLRQLDEPDAKEFILRQITTLSGVMDTFYKRLRQLDEPDASKEEELRRCLRGALTGLELLEADAYAKPYLPGLPDLIKRCKEALK